MAFGRREKKGAEAEPPEASESAATADGAAATGPAEVPTGDTGADAPAEPNPASEPPSASSGPDDAIHALSQRIESLELTLAKVLAEAKQTGDFVRQMSRTLGEGSDAIRSQAVSETSEAVTRSHTAVLLARIDAEAREDEAVAGVLQRVEAEVDAELEFLGITPIIPAVGDPIDTKTMRTRGEIPGGIDPATARKTVDRVLACGYQFPDRRVLPTVSVRWETAENSVPSHDDAALPEQPTTQTPEVQ